MRHRQRARICAALLIPLLLATACGPHTGPPPPAPAPAEVSAENPCTDERYQELRDKAIEDMSEREYQYFLQRDRACTEYQQAITETQPHKQTAQAIREASQTWQRVALAGLMVSVTATAIYLMIAPAR